MGACPVFLRSDTSGTLDKQRTVTLGAYLVWPISGQIKAVTLTTVVLSLVMGIEYTCVAHTFSGAKQA